MAYAVEIMVQLCDVLVFAHRIGIVHRDLKPDNIMVLAEPDERGAPRIKVLDFGVAKLVAAAGPTKSFGRADEQLTSAGAQVGTPTHMAPELVRGGTVDARTDLYACGVILFQLLTGTLPFQDPNPLRLMLRQVDEPPPSPSRIVPEIPPELESIVLWCLEKAPDDRPATALELMEALLKVLAVL